jgi:ferredoxin
VTDFLERRMGALTVRIDRNLCVGFGDCMEPAPEFFELDDDGIIRFQPAAAVAAPTEAQLRAACDACPVDALSLLDDSGVQLAP